MRGCKSALVVYDLIDERFPIVEFPNGSFVTQSNEFRQAGMDLSGCTVHEFGSPQHTLLWQQAWVSFVEMLRNCQLLDRLVVHAAPWAATIRGMEGLPGGMEEIVHANAWLSNCVDRIAQDIPSERILTVDEKHWVADPKHKWGVSPFHYVPEYYAQFLDRLALLMDDIG